MSYLFRAGAQIAQGRAEQEAALYNQRRALMEADARRRESADQASLDAGAAERAIGAAIAAAGAGGFTLAGSASDVLGDLAGQRSFDQRSTIYQGELDRQNLQAEAQMQGKRAKRAMQGAWLAAGATLIEGAQKSFGGR